MKPYLLSLALGLLVGVIYALFQVRSPAPPVIALVGLLGILLGEQIPPLVKQLVKPDAAAPRGCTIRSSRTCSASCRMRQADAAAVPSAAHDVARPATRRLLGTLGAALPRAWRKPSLEEPDMTTPAPT